MLNTFPGQCEIISRSGLGDVCSSAECWEAEEGGESLVSFCFIKKKCKARSSCGPQTQHIWAKMRSRQKVMLWFTFPGSKTQRSEERKRSEGRTEQGWNRGEEPRERKGTVRCFSRGQPCKNEASKGFARRSWRHKLPVHIHLLVCSVRENNVFVNITNPLILLFTFKPFSPDLCPDGNICTCV